MNEPVRLLVIDNVKAPLFGLADTIRRESSYHVITADNGSLGIQVAEEYLPHLIICDLIMPPPDGWAVLKALSRNPATAKIPFIFLVRTGEQDKVNGMDLVANDFMTKPFSKDELLARISAALRRKDTPKPNEGFKSEEEISALSNKIREILQSFSTDHTGLAEAMAQMLSLHDNETVDHARRVVELSNSLARELGVEESLLHHIYLGALLHDIGKVGIPDSILLKPGLLTNGERMVMMTHSTLGKRILQPLGLPPTVIDLVHHHHECWDGSGYPGRLVGKKIPLSARLFAIVDVWDALTSDRPYRKAWSREGAIAYISEQAGKHFDPNIVEKFLVVIEREGK